MKPFLSALLLGLVSSGLHAADEKPAAPAYPLTTCVVSDEPLGSMGETFVYLHKEAGKPDREIRLCCKMCVGQFKKDPAKYLSKLDTPDAPKTAPHAGHAH